MSSYREVFERSITDPAGFWGEQAGLVDWIVRPTTVLDDSAIDTLTGDPAGPNSALDWYFKAADDVITARQNGEKINNT